MFKKISFGFDSGVNGEIGMDTVACGFGTGQENTTEYDARFLRYTTDPQMIIECVGEEIDTMTGGGDACAFICTNSTTKQSTCGGDSGSSLLYKSGDSYVIIGTLTGGVQDCDGSAAIWGAWMNVTKYQSWYECIMSGLTSAECTCGCGEVCSKVGTYFELNVRACQESPRKKKICEQIGGTFECSDNVASCTATGSSFHTNKLNAEFHGKFDCTKTDGPLDQWCEKAGGTVTCSSNLFTCSS